MQQSWNIVARFSGSLGLFAGLCGLAVAGCSKETTTGTGKPGTVGIVDLDAVSKSVGWATDINDDRNGAVAAAKLELKSYQDSVTKAWEERRKAIGEAAHLNADQMKIINATQINGDDVQKMLSKEQKDDFFRSVNEANQAINSAGQQAQQVLQQREAVVNDSYIEAMKPAVRRVAVAAGVTTVLPAKGVFYYDPVVDLSTQVEDDLRKAMPQHSMPAMPKLNFQEFHFSTAPAPVTPAAVTPAPPRTSSDTSH